MVQTTSNQPGQQDYIDRRAAVIRSQNPEMTESDVAAAAKAEFDASVNIGTQDAKRLDEAGAAHVTLVQETGRANIEVERGLRTKQIELNHAAQANALQINTSVAQRVAGGAGFFAGIGGFFKEVINILKDFGASIPDTLTRVIDNMVSRGQGYTTSPLRVGQIAAVDSVQAPDFNARQVAAAAGPGITPVAAAPAAAPSFSGAAAGETVSFNETATPAPAQSAPRFTEQYVPPGP